MSFDFDEEEMMEEAEEEKTEFQQHEEQLNPEQRNIFEKMKALPHK